MDLPRKLLLPFAPIYARQAQRELAALLEAHAPDVVHLHNAYPLLSPWIIRTAHACGVPVVHTVHNYRQVCASGSYFRDGHICTDCRGRSFAFPAIVHSCYRASAAQSAIMATALAAHRTTWRTVDRFIALNADVARHLEDFGISADRIVVKSNAVPDPGEHDELGSGFLFAGLLSPEKGIRLLIEAWSRHPPGTMGELRIAGDGPLRGLVEQTAARRHDVVYLGLLDAAELRRAMRAAAVFLAPSTCFDVAPMVVSEALANARPVLGTAMGGIPFLIGADRPPGSAPAAGWVVEPTVDAFTAMLPRARSEAASLTAVARTRYLTALHPDILTATLIEIYREVRSAEPAKVARGCHR